MYSVFTLTLEVLKLFERKIMNWYTIKISLIVLKVENDSVIQQQDY